MIGGSQLKRVMHQTTVRFGSETWDALAVASDEEGVSVAQFVREAAVERLARWQVLMKPPTQTDQLRGRVERARTASAEEIRAARALDSQRQLASAKARRVRAEFRRNSRMP